MTKTRAKTRFCVKPNLAIDVLPEGDEYGYRMCREAQRKGRDVALHLKGGRVSYVGTCKRKKVKKR